MKASSTWPDIQYYVSLILLAVIFSKLWNKHAQKKIEQKFATEKGCQPLLPWGARWPFGLGLLVKVSHYAKKQQLLHFFVTALEQCPRTWEQNVLGATSIGTIEPENVEAVLSKQFSDFGLGLRSPSFYPLLGSGIFTQDGPEWKHSRDLLRPQFVQKRSENFEQLRTSVKDLIECLPQNGVMDLQPLFFRLTFDTTTFLLFGKSMCSLQSEDVAGQEMEFADAFNLAQDYLSHRSRLGKYYWLMNDRAFRNACKTCHRFVDDAVRSAVANFASQGESVEGESTHTFLNALIQKTSNPKILRDQCLNILLAGRDTTACLLSWTFRLLARHPRVLEKLRAEIGTTIGVGTSAPQPTRNDLKKMFYLNLVIKEVLRLYPSVPINGRTAVKMTTLPRGGGKDGKSPILVRAGEGITYLIYAIHRRKDIYGSDAEEFRPERWKDQKLKDVGYGYLPFNGGPRVCLGQEFALMEAGYTIVRIIQQFRRIELPEDEAHIDIGMEKQNLTLVVVSAGGCRVNLGREV
ncbi:cytochrome P450 [Tothia fuscella]|uniref:Cytochrome P450 n=1 Tax=Tothia fuscella TaxID=1048955 RepID=A0A9P4NSU0_9PEZI|nr:cytochrome P450 [Tothia fuscella]